MPARRIGLKSVAALTCPADKDRVFLWDDALSGFGVAAFPSGKKIYVVQYRQNGRSRRMTLCEHGRKTPDEARSMAKKLLGAVEDGADPIEQKRAANRERPFREVSEEFMRLHVGAKRKDRTAEEYNSLLKLHILPAIGSRRINDIRRFDVAKLHSSLQGRPSTANRCVAVISSIWNWAAKRDEVEAGSNPAAGIERYRERSRDRYLSAAELGRLGDALHRAETEGLPWDLDETKPLSKHVPKDRYSKIDQHAVGALRLLILTGARLKEILTAKWDYVNWERGLLLLPDSKTGKKTIYLSSAALAVLNALPQLKDNPYIIPGTGRRPKGGTQEEKPEPAPRHDIKRPWAMVSRAAGLEGVRIHDLRHSFAAVGAGASLGLPIVGKLLGHSQPATTARYAHLDADPMRRAANLIGNQISAALSGRQAEVIPYKRFSDQGGA
jgi:integrase